MEIIFNGRHTDVDTRFRDQAAAKLSKFEKLDQKAIRVDVEVSVERNPRLASQKERVELTIISRGPAIRAEAAAEDRFAALDLALAKLDAQLRRAIGRRKRHHAGHGQDRIADGAPLVPDGRGGAAAGSVDGVASADSLASAGGAGSAMVPRQGGEQESPGEQDSVVPIDMDGDGPLVVRQKFHRATAISIDQALLEMELVGHDFYLFHDLDEDMPSVVYRRRGYQYGVIRLVEASGPESSDGSAEAAGVRLPVGQKSVSGPG